VAAAVRDWLHSALSICEVAVGSSHCLPHLKAHYWFFVALAAEEVQILLKSLIGQYHYARDWVSEAVLVFEAFVSCEPCHHWYNHRLLPAERASRVQLLLPCKVEAAS
jgi:hypothetical protein